MIKNIFNKNKESGKDSSTYGELDSGGFNLDKQFDVQSNTQTNDEAFNSPKTKKNPFSKLMNKIKKDEDLVETQNENTEILLNVTNNPTEVEDGNDKYDFTRKSVDPVMLNDRRDEIVSRRSSISFSDSEEKVIPLIGNLPSRKQYQIALVILLGGFVGLVSGSLLYNNGSNRRAENLSQISNLSSNLQKLDTNFSNAVLGKKDAFDNTKKAWDLIESNSLELKKLPNDFSGETKQEKLATVNTILGNIEQIKNNVDKLKDNAKFIQNTSGTLQMVSTDISTMTDLLDRLGYIYIQLGANQAELGDIYLLKNSLQSINANITGLLLSEKITPETISSLNKSILDFKKTLEELYNGDANKGINPLPSGIPMHSYKKLANVWLSFTDRINVINSKGNDLILVRNLSAKNNELSVEIENKLANLNENTGVTQYKDIIFGELLIGLAILLVLFSLFLLLYIYSVEKDNLSLLEKIAGKKQRDAVDRLIAEMAPLASGDLTQKTTISDESIGLLADTINTTVESLSSVVTKIKDTSLTMREKANEVNHISLDMLQNNEKQANSIINIGNSVINISKSIEEISMKSNQGAKVAEKSIQVSEKGAQQVISSLESMKKINNNMEETDHLMKKVTDSSKQISEIVDLLAEISENTSILALNATIQAAKAGEAGKGFKIVADSIQGLADRAGEATRRVGALIAAVQTDIQATEDAVKKASKEASAGAELAELANESINEMSSVSNNLAKIISTISEDAKRNANDAKKASNEMKTVLSQTEENKYATQKTAASITEIAEISNQLSDSVKSFKVDK